MKILIGLLLVVGAVLLVLLFDSVALLHSIKCELSGEESYCGFLKVLFDFQTLIAGLLAIFAALLALWGAKVQADSAFKGAKEQADSALNGALLQSRSAITLDQQRKEDLKQGVAASTKAIAHELTYLMRLCASTAYGYQREELESRETNVLAYQDCVRSMKISTHNLLPTDMATLALLDPRIGRRTAILYSKIARYENLIEECMALGSKDVPEHSAELYGMLAYQALQGRRAAVKLWLAVRRWQRVNRPQVFV